MPQVSTSTKIPWWLLCASNTKSNHLIDLVIEAHSNHQGHSSKFVAEHGFWLRKKLLNNWSSISIGSISRTNFENNSICTYTQKKGGRPNWYKW